MWSLVGRLKVDRVLCCLLLWELGCWDFPFALWLNYVVLHFIKEYFQFLDDFLVVWNGSYPLLALSLKSKTFIDKYFPCDDGLLYL